MISLYDYKPAPNYFKATGEKEARFFLGFELEVEFPGAGRISEAEKEVVLESLRPLLSAGIIYLKYDGSVCGGFEIVSHPFSSKWLEENKKLFSCIFELDNLGCKSYDTLTCGMHIHISKSYFTTNHLYKLLRVFYGSGENKGFVFLISQRTRDRFLHNATLDRRVLGASLDRIAREKSRRE